MAPLMDQSRAGLESGAFSHAERETVAAMAKLGLRFDHRLPDNTTFPFGAALDVERDHPSPEGNAVRLGGSRVKA